MTAPKIIVIGAGMAGLSAAWRLTRAGVDVTVYEKSSRVGGRVFTDIVNGTMAEAGAQFIANFYSNTRRIIRDIGLQDEVIPIAGHSGIVRDGHLFELRYDVRSALSPLIGTMSKIKLARVLPQLITHWSNLDIHALNRAHGIDTANLAEYSHRQLDSDVLEHLLEPVLSGMFYWTPEETSQAMLFILLKAGAGMRLLTIRGGLGRLPSEIAKSLNIQLNEQVVEVELVDSGRYVCRVATRDGEIDQFADGIVCSIPALEVPRLFADLESPDRAFFERVTYSSTVSVQIGVNQRMPQAVYGIFFPRREPQTRYLAAATVESAKYPMQSPSNRDVVGLFSSDLAARKLRGNDQDFILSALLADLGQLGSAYTLDRAQLFHRGYDWAPAVPHFGAGYFRRLNAFKDRQMGRRRVVFAGDYLGGPFIEGAVTSGLDAADQLLRQLS